MTPLSRPFPTLWGKVPEGRIEVDDKEQIMTPNFPTVPPHHWRLAREKRKAPTPAERALWDALHRNPFGVRFRRQYPVGPYIVDFACMSRSLIIEVEGSIHDEKDVIELDVFREEYLHSRGLRIIRFRNDEVLENITEVMQRIKAALVIR